jgi:tyrosinase
MHLPPGTGGGCVFKGPFKDMVVHLGPVSLPVYGSPNSTGQPNPLADNPRCLKRDLNPGVAKSASTFRNTTELILKSKTIEVFQGIMVSIPHFYS